MKEIKILIGLVLIVGFPCPIVSLYFFNMGHSILFAPLSIVSAFVGTVLLLGLKGFKDKPKNIGNMYDDTMPVINQTWAVFAIALIFNLIMSNLTGL